METKDEWREGFVEGGMWFRLAPGLLRLIPSDDDVDFTIADLRAMLKALEDDDE